MHPRLQSAVFVVLCLLLTACGPDAEGPSSSDAPVEPTAERTVDGFREVGRKAGLHFEMNFLPGEQGANFKINLYDHGSGVSVGDYDGDGWDDLYFVNQFGPNALYRNQGDGTFKDVTRTAKVALDDRICTSAAFADIDNDGDQDLFVASTRGGNSLFRNEGNSTFVDVTNDAGVAYLGHSQGVAFFDYDTDGFLDLFVTNTAEWTLDKRDPSGTYFEGPSALFDLVGSETEASILYRNRGDGTFEDVSEDVGLDSKGWEGDIAVFDADGDGDQDLFVTHMFGRSRLLRNDEGKRFTDVTADAMPYSSWGAVGCKPFDFDGDGRLDLFIADMHSDMWMFPDDDPRSLAPKRKYGGPEGPLLDRGAISADEVRAFREAVMLYEDDVDLFAYGNTLYRNVGDGHFEEISDAVGAETLWPWGIAAADFDGNGYEDLFLTAGMGHPYGPWPNSLLMNSGDGFLEDHAKKRGIDPRPEGEFLEEKIGGHLAAASSRSAATLDFDRDGRPDLVVNNFNERAHLYRNQFAKKHWISFRLRGTKSNRDAVGAIACVKVGGRMLGRQVCAAGGYLGQSSNTLLIGLGDHETIEDCEIIWPNGDRQKLSALAVDREYDVVEGEAPVLR